MCKLNKNASFKDKAIYILSTICMILVLFVSFGYAAEKTPKVINMKYASFVGPRHILNSSIEALCKALTEASKGTVIVKHYGAEALGKFPEFHEITTSGLADLSYFCPVFTPAQFPLTLFMELPFTVSSARVGTEVLQELLNRNLITY